MSGMNPGPGRPGGPREAIVAFGGRIHCEDIGPGNYGHAKERLGSQWSDPDILMDQLEVLDQRQLRFQIYIIIRPVRGGEP